MKARLAYLLRWLEAAKPDVVGLQELKMTEDKFPIDEFRAAGYNAAIHGQKSWNGVAILTRGEANVTQVGLPGQDELGARLITADVESLSFTTVYCPNGKSIDHADYGRKLAWYDALAEHFEANHDPNKATVLCGDFNIVPTALDSWNEESLAGGIFHTSAERDRFQRLLKWGFVDLYRDARPQEPGFTWWDYRAGSFHKGQGLRIDLILGTAPVRKRLGEIHFERQWRKKLDGLIASDHAPLWMDLE